MFLVTIAKAIFSPILLGFQWITSGKAKPILTKILTLSDLAIPVIEQVANLQENSRIPTIAKALQTIGLTAEEVLDNTDKIFHDGARLALASEALRQHLIELVQAHGKVEFEQFTFNSVEDILGLDSGQLRAAVQAGFALFSSIKKEDDKKKEDYKVVRQQKDQETKQTVAATNAKVDILPTADLGTTVKQPTAKAKS